MFSLGKIMTIALKLVLERYSSEINHRRHYILMNKYVNTCRCFMLS
jgi:hypothetical protein